MILNHYITLGIILFVLGLCGVILRRNVLIMLMSFELMLNAVNIILVAYARFLENMDGQIAAFLIIILAAAESGIGLAIVIALFRRKLSVQSNYFTLLKDKI